MLRIITIIFLAAGAFVLPLHSQQARLLVRDGRDFSADVVGVFGAALRLKNSTGTEFDVPWTDVITLTTAAPVSLVLANGDKVTGQLSGVEDGSALLVRSEVLGLLRIATSALAAPKAPPVAEPPGPPTPLKPTDWNGRVSLGASISAGNSDLLTAALDALLQRDWSHNHVEFRFNATYATSNGQEQSNSQMFFGQLKHYYEPRFYSYGSVELYRDEIQDIEFRGLFNVGAGYEMWRDSDKELLTLEGGVGYRFETYQGSTDPRHDATVRAAMLYKDIFFEDLAFSQSLEFIMPVNDPGSYIGRSETVISVPLSTEWSFRSSLRIQYLGNPANNSDPLDLLATVGLEYRF